MHIDKQTMLGFESFTESHYSQTNSIGLFHCGMFESFTESHYFQTHRIVLILAVEFESFTESHYSQTASSKHGT